ncbi:MAG: carbamoyl transferase, NodU family [Stygiobacter sp.]|nr:MAG: carbamoyl transferase, NodU family [Stygiobacter sp.]
MKVLGLNHDMYISSAALIVDGEVVAGAAEERFTRQKRTRAFPRRAVQFCLDQAGIGIDAVDAVANAWNPGVYMQKFNPLVSSSRRFKSEYLYSVPDNLLAMFPDNLRDVDHIHQRLALGGSKALDVYFVTHHRVHAANAFLLSPFEEAAIITADSQGEVESTTIAHGEGNRIKVLRTQNHPHSLGAFYATFTEFLGFRPHSDEWKVMALAAFSTPAATKPVEEVLRREVLQIGEDGFFELNLRYFKDFLHELPFLYTPAMTELLGQPRAEDDPLEERHYAIAAAMQNIVEDIAFRLMREAQRLTGADNVCAAGGFFMNSVLNGRILTNTPFKQVYISSSPDDSGNAIGAAAYLYNHILGQPERHHLTHNFLGPDYSDAVIEAEINKSHLSAEKVADPSDTAARLLADGAVIGWFQGRMEFGQRALGNRSILADPRGPDTKAKVNAAVKFREPFRPFAPAILAEYVSDWFDIEPGNTVPFMEKVYPIRREKQAEIPAVVHADGSGRLQTVQAATNPRFHALIDAFRKRTGVPIVLNTSFNLNEEPIVCRPIDAIRTFHSCGLDALVMGSYVLRKPT